MFRLRAALLLALDTTALVVLRPRFGELAGHLRHGAVWLRSDVDRAVTETCAAALWLLAAWVALGLLVTLASACSGRGAAWANAVRVRLFPAATRRVLAGALGLGVVLAPVAAAASPAPIHTPSSSASTPAWPLDPTPARTVPTSAPASSPISVPSGPAWPSNSAAVMAPQAATPSPAHTRPPRPPRPREVVVQPGDSLWLIAQRRLGPAPTDAQVAAEWPRWYAANRSTLGADPALIHPGQILHAPAEDS